MQITLDTKNAPASEFEFKGCKPSKTQPKGPFDGTNPFVDLHLDFPVRFGKYVMGNTPYMMAMKELMDSDDGEPSLASEKIDFHNLRLDQLNYFHDREHEIKTIIRLYSGKINNYLKRG